MALRTGMTVLLLGLILALLGGAALAQEQTPGETTETPGGTTVTPGETTEIPPGGTTTAPPGHVYFYLNGELTPVEREITGGGQMNEFAAMELLKGPTEEEKAAGYVTYIPEGVSFMSSTIKNDRSEYTANLSRELLELSGDPDAAAKALAQIEKTLQDVSGIERINITVPAEETGPGTLDAYEALGVPRGSAQEETKAEGKGLSRLAWLIIAVSVCVALIIVLGVLLFAIPARR